MSYPSSPKPLATGLESSDATGGGSPRIPPCPDGCTRPFEYVSNQEWCASSSMFPHESLRPEL